MKNELLGVGRGYLLAFAYVVGAIVIAFAALQGSNPNWKPILEWYGGIGLTLVVPVVAAKEAGKIFTSRRTDPRKP